MIAEHLGRWVETVFAIVRARIEREVPDELQQRVRALDLTTLIVQGVKELGGDLEGRSIDDFLLSAGLPKVPVEIGEKLFMTEGRDLLLDWYMQACLNEVA